MFRYLLKLFLAHTAIIIAIGAVVLPLAALLANYLP
jgi:hypothetical protein